MKSLLKHTQRLALAAALTAAVGACDEKLDTGAACPVLCPHQVVEMQDTVFFPIIFDSSVAGFPVQGNEGELYVATLGDTMETAAVVRFDSLPTFFRRSDTAEDSLIYAVDSANVIFVPATDTVGAPLTVEIYSVDLGGPDDADPDLARTALTPDRLIGSRTIPADSLRDSVIVMIDNAAVLAVIQAQQQDPSARGLRIAIRVNPGVDGKTDLSIFSADNVANFTRLRFRPHLDTAVAKEAVFPRSKAPENVFIRATMQDYQLVVREPAPPPSNVFRVGGIPGRRVYVEFDIPQSLIDSTNVVRATLELTQRPNPAAPQVGDTAIMREFRIVAGPEVTDLDRRLLFTQRFRIIDSIAVIASDSGRRDFEIIDLIREWRGSRPERTPRAMAFAVQTEGAQPRFLDFFSSEAPESVRPRLKVFYLPRREGGLP